MARIIQPSFAKGEISPALYGRVDTQMYGVALRQARNFIIHPYGGASSRDGLRYLEPVKDHTKEARLIPFEFKTEDQYVLEFGDLYMRVMRNDAHVLDTSEQEVITGITQANPAVVTTGTHGYDSGQEVFISGVVGMTQVNNKRFNITVLSGTTFSLQDQVTDVDINSTAFTAYSSAGTADIIFEIVTPYLEAELFEITYVQNAAQASTWLFQVVIMSASVSRPSRPEGPQRRSNFTGSVPSFVSSLVRRTSPSFARRTLGVMLSNDRHTSSSSLAKGCQAARRSL